MNMLFICKGNVARSQMGEAFFRQAAGAGHSVSSAGTALSGPEQPISDLLPLTKEVIDSMNEVGIDISGTVRRQLTESMAAKADKIIAIVEGDFKLPAYVASSSKLVRWDIPDPKGKDIEFTRMVRDRIKAAVGELVKSLQNA